jgi:hypothetical protein
MKKSTKVILFTVEVVKEFIKETVVIKNVGIIITKVGTRQWPACPLGDC